MVLLICCECFLVNVNGEDDGCVRWLLFAIWRGKFKSKKVRLAYSFMSAVCMLKSPPTRSGPDLAQRLQESSREDSAAKYCCL